MGCSVAVTASFSKRFDAAVESRLSNVGPHSAASLVEERDRVISLLETTPRYGSLVDKSQGRIGPLRWVHMPSYIAVYSIDETRNTVVLLDLFYESQDWKRKILS